MPRTNALGLGSSQKVKPKHIYRPLVVCCSTGHLQRPVHHIEEDLSPNKSQDLEIRFSLVLFDVIPVIPCILVFIFHIPSAEQVFNV